MITRICPLLNLGSAELPAKIRVTPRGHKFSPYPENSAFPWDQSHLQDDSAAPEVAKLAAEELGCRPTVSNPTVLSFFSMGSNPFARR